jgi:hypothetical protein
VSLCNIEVKITVVNGKKNISAGYEGGGLYEQRDDFQQDHPARGSGGYRFSG